jgi:hypothetical protein
MSLTSFSRLARANIEARDSYGSEDTPLLIFCRRGLLKLVQRCLEGGCVDSRDASGMRGVDVTKEARVIEMLQKCRL